jgi:hypothetical protein
MDIEDIFRLAVSYAQEPNARVAVLCLARHSDALLARLLHGKGGTYSTIQRRWVSGQGGELRVITVADYGDLDKLCDLEFTHVFIHEAVKSAEKVSDKAYCYLRSSTYQGEMALYTPWGTRRVTY